MKGPSVVVVGAGVCGLSTAFHLTQLGVSDVLVLEQSVVASGSSGLSVGNIPGLWEDPLDIELRARSLKLLEELEDEIGLRWTGNIRMSLDAGDESMFDGAVSRQGEFGLEAKLVDREELQQLVPDMRCDDVAVAIYMPHAGHVDGHLLCDAYARRATASGATIRTRARLTDASRTPTGEHLLETTAGPISCDVVVNAAGAWSDRVGRLLGFEAPVIPQRHEVFIVRTPKKISYTMPQVGEAFSRRSSVTGSGLYFQQEDARTLLAGIHTGVVVDERSENPDEYRRTLEEGTRTEIARMLLDRLPGLPELTLVDGWAGLYPMSPDERPQVGPCTDDGTVVAACGVGGSGIQVSPMVGQLAAEWIAYGELKSVPAASEFLPTRFAA